MNHFYPPHISYSQLKIADMIGVGGFGKVFRGYFECKEVAIKEVKMPIGESLEVTSDRVQQEARLLWVLKHKNVISLIGVCLEVRKKSK